MKAESKQYLTDNLYIWESAKLGVHKHLSEIQAQTLLSIAKEIKPDINFQIRECQDCINQLVNFVYRAYDRTAKQDMVKMSFPKQEPKKK